MREGIYVHLGLIHVVVWQKPTHFKATILQLKINLKNIFKKLMDHFDWVMTIANTFLAFRRKKKENSNITLSYLQQQIPWNSESTFFLFQQSEKELAQESQDLLLAQKDSGI